MGKSDRLTIQLAPQHRDAIARIAQADGEAVAIIVRRLIKAEALRRGLWPQANHPVTDDRQR
jgi:hypothetical protein